MSKMTTLATMYGLPLQSTPEDLEGKWSTVLTYGTRVLVSGYYYSPDRKSWIAAVYEFLDDDQTTCEDPLGLRTVSEERFTDNGHAIAWAIEHRDD